MRFARMLFWRCSPGAAEACRCPSRTVGRSHNAEAADIVRIAGKYGDALCVVGVDVKEQPEKARGFRELHKIPYRIILDDTGSVSKALGFNALPTHVFLDTRGVITCISEGDLSPDQMDNEVAVALARAPAPRS